MSPQVKAVVFSRDGQLLAAAGATASIKVWDVPSYSERHALPCDVTVNALAFTADSLLLASAGMDKKVRVWDTSTGTCRHELVHDDYVLAIAFAPAQRAPEMAGSASLPILAAGGGDKLISIWNAATGAPAEACPLPLALPALAPPPPPPPPPPRPPPPPPPRPSPPPPPPPRPSRPTPRSLLSLSP
jgi:WD40 repeat protein